MTDKYKNKYRIPSTRLRTWDYGWNAPYFVTICTQYRKCWFGEIIGTHWVEKQNFASLPNAPTSERIMKLSPIGQIAHDCWLAIPEHFPFVILGEFQVMPNHVHGIVIIDKQDAQNGPVQNVPNPTATTEPRPTETTESKNKFGPQSQNLASIIRGFKVGVTIEARKFDDGFGWQSRFHDHIIRDERSYYHISEYIKNNPHNWESDDFNPGNPKNKK